MTKPVDSPVTIVTGATRGIGKAIALKLADEGHNLALVGRDSSLLGRLSDHLKNKVPLVSIYTGDVKEPDFAEECVNSVMGQFDRVDNLINNAGVAHFTLFRDSTFDELKAQIETNLYGVYNFTKAVIPGMINKKRGTIINVSSIAGKNGFVRGTTYAASKHALMGFTKSLMMEVREHNIRVSAVCPGSVNTDMIIDTPVQPEKIEKVLNPEDIAEVVSTILSLPANAMVSEVEVRPTNTK
jgi:3-oxoacyl-[acyl-carrier protein] reductase